ncbi:HLH-domain-containing protein [Lichtheimia hyalospora FSU 10163]|nr:HLH-domain-containing protein [Lichtheimia hyalospora FSU 10163]
MSSPPLPPFASSDDMISSQQQQKKQRTLHSSIEKRRRERINDKIQQLKDMVPACNPYSEKNPIAGPSLYQPLHKLTILQAAIEYIEEMHQKLLDASSPPSDATSSHLLDDPKIIQVIEHAQQCANGTSYRKILE